MTKNTLDAHITERNRHFHEFFQNSRDGLVVVNTEGNFIDANPAYCQMLGYTLEELRLKQNFFAITPPHWHEWEKTEILTKRLMYEGYSGIYEKEYIRKDGHIFPVEIQAHAFCDKNNRPRYFWGIARDITLRKKAETDLKNAHAQLEQKVKIRTAELKQANHKLEQDIKERKRAEQKLADSQRHLADIIDFLPDPTWVINTKGRVIAWNRAIEKMSEIPKKEMIGKGNYAYAVPFYGKARPVLIDLILNPDPQWEKEYLIFKKGNLFSSQSFNPDMGEKGRYFASTASKLYNFQGEVIGAIESVRDITRTKESEQDREHLIEELQDAVARIKTLNGLVPICSHCKSIRDDKGYWNRLESYIEQHSDASFSHGICPDCSEKLYGDKKWYLNMKKKKSASQ